MNIQNLVLSAGFGIAATVIATAVAASPVVVTLTEGTGQNRALVEGSVDLEDAPSGSPGIDLNAFNGGNAFDDGDMVQLHGRIVGATDVFIFEFSSSVDFDIMFDFDGYDLEGGGSVAAGFSGLIDQALVSGKDAGDDPVTNGGGKKVKFSLLDSMNNEVDSEMFTTNVVSTTEATGDIFMNIAAGSYSLVVDGSVGTQTNKKALYDIKISAVPLPLPGLLLLGGLGGLALARRRKAAA